MAVTEKRDEARLNVRLRQDIKDRIERAAVLSGKTVTEFAVSALAESARNVLEQHQITTLSDRDREIFLAMLDEPSMPNKALKRAAKTHKRLIAE